MLSPFLYWSKEKIDFFLGFCGQGVERTLMASEPAAQITTYVYAPNGAWIKITRDDGSLLTPEEQAALLKQRSDEASERIAAFLGERKEPTDDVSEVVTYTYATRPELRESFGRGHAGEDGGAEDEEEGETGDLE